MTPDPTRDHSALRWVRSELDAALRQARLQLEDYVDGASPGLDDCVRHLHQVHGTLQLVQVYGGAMLAGELEALAQALSQGQAGAPDAAAEVLMMGIVQLPAYLERVENGEPDIPLILLPLLNDLRASRNAPLVSEVSLFAPKLDSLVAADEVLPGSGNPALPGLLKTERLTYHRGLLNWFRDLDSVVGLSSLREVMENVGAQVRTRRLRHLMDASEALVAALQDGMPPNSAIKGLFGKLDQVFRRIIEQGEEAVARDFPLELLKNLLYYVARSDSEDPVVQAIRRSADLANSFPDISYEDVRNGTLGGPGKELFDAVGAELKTDLRGIMDQLDLYMRGDRADFDRLSGLVDPVRRVGDTLGMVGRGELRSRLMPHCERLTQAVDSQQPPTDDQLMGLAGDLLYVESALVALAQAPAAAPSAEQGSGQAMLQGMSPAEFRGHMQAAIGEGFVELARTKDAILHYLDSPGDRSVLEGIPERVHKVAGVLTVMEQPEAARLLENLRRYLADLASGARVQPDSEQSNALAELVSGIELHMDSLIERRPDHGRALLVAEAASERLGLVDGELPQPAADHVEADVALALAESDLAEPEFEVESSTGPVAEEVLGTQVAEAASAPEAATPEPAEIVPDLAADFPAEAVSSTPEQAPDLEAIDSEILAIFVEEAREELQAIREAYPVWRQDTHQDESLTRVRRAFHTLKGSGRLVGAMAIGEFAWAVENLLNRVIEGTVPASNGVFALLEQVIDTLPSLIDEYEAGVLEGAHTATVQRLQDQAFALADGGSTPEPAAVAPAVPADAILVDESALIADSLPSGLDDESAGTSVDLEAFAGSQSTVSEAPDQTVPGIWLDEAPEGLGDSSQSQQAGSGESDLPESAELIIDEIELVAPGQVDTAPGPGVEQQHVAAEVEAAAELPSTSLAEPVIPAEETLAASGGSAAGATLDLTALQQDGTPDADVSGTQPAGKDSPPAPAEADISLASDLADLDLSSEELLLEDVAADIDEALAIDSALNESLLDEDQVGEGKGEPSLFASGLEELSTDDEPEAFTDASDDLLPDSALDSLPSEAVSEEQEVESILLPQELEPAPIALESALNEIFTTETRTHLETIGRFVEDCRGRPAGCVYNEHLGRALHTLNGAARMAEVKPIAELAGALEHWINLQVEAGERTDSASMDLLERAHFVINAVLDVVNRPGALIPTWQPLLKEIEREVEKFKVAPEEPDSTEQLSELSPDLDPELLEIFLEEANELSEGMEQDYEGWCARTNPAQAVAQLQRYLHTIKGSARLAGVPPIGDLAHAMESLFESIVEGRVEDTEERRSLVRYALDALHTQIEALVQRRGIPNATGICERLEAAARGEQWAPMAGAVLKSSAPRKESLESAVDAATGLAEDEHENLSETTLLSDSQLLTDSELLSDSDFATTTAIEGDGGVDNSLQRDSRVIQFPGRSRHGGDTGPESDRRQPPPAEETTDQAPASQERVRVRAELLDHMVNNAGEVGIYRARLEQQNKTQGYNLDELSQTIERLRNQLRSLELETEAQILSRFEREHENDASAADFDPLELDRYSTMQQLSRALSETVNDLSNIGVTLQELNRDSDTLLLQQARITNDLQDGLLRTRMVPVGSRTARLQRVVRQTAQVLDKQAELQVVGGLGEIDRAILERMLAPLEHLLRNAVAHGIESPGDRSAVGKPELGTVTLSMGREGSDVVLTVTDDGRGFDREAIRRKAIQRGLIDPDVDIEDADLDQLVMEPGFSTAEDVSQVAGRGVGMDVVLSEIKQLGGSIEISTRRGLGTRFDIRLPFTLAITESLLVSVGEEVYAVPHGSIDGIVRITREQLEACYLGKQETFEYGDVAYDVRYLGGLLSNALPSLPEGIRWFPMLLVRVGEHRVAIQTDGLLGNRQIVVKSVGLQLSTVRWFTGATILADGRIALILDVSSLVRIVHQHQQPQQQLLDQQQTQSEGVTVMVVDDSITVRKVTTRLLERHNMNVLTAKDGVDAVTLLQEQKPDVMLLDIEMPRMDGFELARHMRSTEGLQDIPIIMITSRTGDKHRNLAMDLGVKRYLGKPYQESDLLENIYTVLAETDDA